MKRRLPPPAVVATVGLAVVILTLSVLTYDRTGPSGGSTRPVDVQPIGAPTVVVQVTLANNSTNQSGEGNVHVLIIAAHINLIADELQIAYATGQMITSDYVSAMVSSSSGAEIATYDSTASGWSEYGQSPYAGWTSGATSPVIEWDTISLSPPAGIDEVILGYSIPGLATGQTGVNLSPS
jgi:hypothetical protein